MAGALTPPYLRILYSVTSLRRQAVFPSSGSATYCRTFYRQPIYAFFYSLCLLSLSSPSYIRATPSLYSLLSLPPCFLPLLSPILSSPSSYHSPHPIFPPFLWKGGTEGGGGGTEGGEEAGRGTHAFLLSHLMHSLIISPC